MATLTWVRRTPEIYRSAVLDRKHFAYTRDDRSKFIASILVFRRWLASDGGGGAGAAARRAVDADGDAADELH